MTRNRDTSNLQAEFSGILGNIRVHKTPCTEQIWVLHGTQDSPKWMLAATMADGTICQLRHPHPDLGDYVLHQQPKNATYSWVLSASAHRMSGSDMYM
jgi:hypothetical protein